MVLTALLILGLALVGCSDDDPVTPPPPTPEPSPVSPDSLMALFGQALETMDAELYESLLHEDIRMFLGPEEFAEFDIVPGTEDLNREETVRAARQLLGGQGVTNWTGASEPGVTGIVMDEMIQMTEWAYGKDGPEEIPNTLVSLWVLSLQVERGGGPQSLNDNGVYQFQVAPTDSADTYLLKGIRPLSDGKVENSAGLAGIHLHYLTNEPPTATFEFTERPGVPWPTYTFDGGGSSDPDGGLAEYPYHWQLGEGAEWTDWWWLPVDQVFETDEPQQVTLEVRDRWGATAQVVQTVTPTRTWLPFPDSPAQLMANFQATYEQMDFQEYRRILHPDFQMILQQETIDEFPDVGMTLDVSEELHIHQRMFSGDDLTDPVSGGLIPGMEEISFWQFNALDTWQMSPPNDLIPNAEFATYDVDFMFSRGQQFTILKAEGLVRFYVTSRDSLHEGSVQQYYQMIGQLDLTGGFKAVETANYGSIKAIYR